MSRELTPGLGRDRLRLWDNQWCLMWDSAIATTPAYKHISTWTNATIDYSNGTRWSGQLKRCREGILRTSYEDIRDIRDLTTWPSNPFLKEM